MHRELILLDLNQADATRVIDGPHDADFVPQGVGIEARVVAPYCLDRHPGVGATLLVSDPASRKCTSAQNRPEISAS